MIKKIKKVTKKELKKLEKKEKNRKDKEWKLEVRKRDKSTCQICGRTDLINCHHIFPREITEDRWKVENGICLCPNHHRFCREISAHKNPMEFVLWLLRNKKKQMNKLLAV